MDVKVLNVESEGVRRISMEESGTDDEHGSVSMA